MVVMLKNICFHLYVHQTFDKISHILSSSNSQAPDYNIQFYNKYCRCDRRAAKRISESQLNYSKLYFCCQERKCEFFQWWCSMNVHSVSDEDIRRNGSKIKSFLI